MPELDNNEENVYRTVELEDELGNKLPYIIIGEVEDEEDFLYALLVPESVPENEVGHAVIARVVVEDGEDVYEFLNDEEANQLLELFVVAGFIEMDDTAAEQAFNELESQMSDPDIVREAEKDLDVVEEVLGKKPRSRSPRK